MSIPETARKTQSAIYLFAASLVLAFCAIGYSALANRNDNIEECQRQHQTAEMFRLFLVEGAKQFQLRPTKPGDTSVEDFVAEAQVLIEKMDCRIDE